MWLSMDSLYRLFTRQRMFLLVAMSSDHQSHHRVNKWSVFKAAMAAAAAGTAKFAHKEGPKKSRVIGQEQPDLAELMVSGCQMLLELRWVWIKPFLK